MTNPPPRTPAQTFGAILNALIRTVDGHSTWGRLARPLGMLIISRIIALRQRFERLHARIAAGTYKPRRPSATPRRRPADPKPRQPNPLPYKFGWLLTLMPGEEMYRVYIAESRSWLENLLQDPEMAALMQAAPASMARALRPLCWMLYIMPPLILARPRRPRHSLGRPRVPPTPPAPASKPAAAKPETPGRRRQPPSPSLSPAPAPAQPPPARACGPPLPRPA